MNKVFVDMSTKKGLHAIAANNRVADVGVFKFKIRDEDTEWVENEEQLSAFGTTIVLRESEVEVGFIYNGRTSDHLGWQGGRVRKSSDAIENQDVVEFVCNDKVREFGELRFPIRRRSPPSTKRRSHRELAPSSRATSYASGQDRSIVGREVARSVYASGSAP